MPIRNLVRTLLEQRAPGLAAGYRVMRDELQFRRAISVSTPYGFALAGDLSMQTGAFEQVETSLLRSCLARADVFIDVGANVGFYTCLGRAAGRRTVAVEPSADNLRYLYRNLRENGWTDVEVWPVALAASPGIMELFGGGTGASLVPGWAGVSAAFSRTVAVTALDSIVGRRFAGQRVLVKVDVEGAEYDMLCGARELLSCVPKPIWLIEIVTDVHRKGGNPNFLATFKLMESFGYRIFKANPILTPVTPSDLAAMLNGEAPLDVNSWLFSADGPPIGPHF